MLITWKGQNYDFCQVKTGQCHNMKPLSLPPQKPLTEFHLKRESLPQGVIGVIIATKLLDVNDNCTQRPFQTHVHCTQGFGSVAQSCMSWGPIEIWRRSGSNFWELLVSLLELVVPLVEVNVENDDGPGCQSSHQESEMTMLWNAHIKQFLDQ